MGRKIPGKKHRGIKDPEKQRAKRDAELEDKINAPPKSLDEQDIPKSLQRVIKLKEATKAGSIGKIKKKKKKKSNGLIRVGEFKPISHPKARPEKVVPIFQQKQGESPHQFLHRVSRETHAFLNETAFEKKYKVEVKRDQKSGVITGLAKQEKSEFDEEKKLKMKHTNIKKKKKVKEGEEVKKLTKTQKKKLRLAEKKNKMNQEDVDEFRMYKDEIKFGEVAHAPPQLISRSNKLESDTTYKPGKKELLLKSYLNSDSSSVQKKKDILKIDRTGKRKNLPVGERRQLEKQQTDVITAYRKLKSQQTAGM
ncbi:coiled-coil domain-containing protein 137 [Prorops nasuta]|uniref:coiled-coil domain-containing protein 137 n=1 Tax=Prorops nasuta TaxID=863751 RepID=UPI0034CFB5BE